MKKKLYEIFKKYNPNYLIHLAAETHVDRSIDDSNDFIKSNILGTYNLLQACQKFLKNKKKKFKFVLMGTDEIFGDMDIKSKNGFTEKSCVNPNNPYSASKASAINLGRAWFNTYDLPILFINCFAFVFVNPIVSNSVMILSIFMSPRLNNLENIF